MNQNLSTSPSLADLLRTQPSAVAHADDQNAWLAKVIMETLSRMISNNTTLQSPVGFDCQIRSSDSTRPVETCALSPSMRTNAALGDSVISLGFSQMNTTDYIPVPPPSLLASFLKSNDLGQVSPPKQMLLDNLFKIRRTPGALEKIIVVPPTSNPMLESTCSNHVENASYQQSEISAHDNKRGKGDQEVEVTRQCQRLVPFQQQRRSYTEAELASAVRAICSGHLGTRRAASVYGIPRSTLRNKICKLNELKRREEALRGDGQTISLADFIQEVMTTNATVRSAGLAPSRLHSCTRDGSPSMAHLPAKIASIFRVNCRLPQRDNYSPYSIARFEDSHAGTTENAHILHQNASDTQE